MKICFVCPWMHVEGGLQKVVTNLMNSLVEKYEITLCIISQKTESPFYPLDNRIRIKYIPESSFKAANCVCRLLGKLIRNSNINLPNFILRKIFYNKKRIKQLEIFLDEEQFDCVVASCGDLSMLLACVDKNKIKSKFIGWQHNSYEDYFLRRGYYYYGCEGIAKELYKNLDEVITLTKKDADSYRKRMKINAQNIYNPLTIRIDNNLSNKNASKNIIFVGRLEWEQKGLNHLVEICKNIFCEYKMTDWNVIIVGDGKDRQKLQNNIVNLGIDKYVKLVGKQKNILQYYRESSILINTSNWEGFGLVITEALECGIPVVAFETDGPSEIIVNGKNGFLIPKYNTDIFAQKVIHLMQNIDDRNEIAKNARLSASNFEMANILTKWERIFEEK